MENIEKNLDKVAGGRKTYEVIEDKDGNFYVIDSSRIGNKAIETKDGVWAILKEEKAAFNTELEAKLNDKDSLSKRLSELH